MVEAFRGFLLPLSGEVADTLQVADNAGTVVNIGAFAFYAAEFRFGIDVPAVIADGAFDVGRPIGDTSLSARFKEHDGIGLIQVLL